jgi:osmotically-inducible protein OsmY
MASTPRTTLAEEDALEAREPAGYRQSDASIREQILRQLALAEGLDTSGLTVDVKDCEVTLIGSMGCYADMQKVEELACAIEGVKQVRNALASRAPGPRAVARRPVGSASKMGKPGYER